MKSIIIRILISAVLMVIIGILMFALRKIIQAFLSQGKLDRSSGEGEIGAMLSVAYKINCLWIFSFFLVRDFFGKCWGRKKGRLII